MVGTLRFAHPCISAMY